MAQCPACGEGTSFGLNTYWVGVNVDFPGNNILRRMYWRFKFALSFFCLSTATLSAQQAATPVFASEQAFTHGVELQQRGDLEGARKAYEESLRMVPRRADALSNLGIVFAHLGDYTRAIDSYKKAIEIDPHLYEVQLNLGIAYYQIQDFESARQELTQVISLHPGNQQARLLNGLCLVALDRLREATIELEAVYRAEPPNLAAAYALATAYLGAGDTEKARKLADGVFSKIDSAESYFIFGSLRLAAKDFNDAIKDFIAAVSLNSRLPLLHSQLGNAYFYSGNREQAKSEFTEELKINPRDFNANYRLGRLLREDGDLEDAAAHIQTALQLRPDDTSTLYEKAQLLQSRSETEMAVDCLETVVRKAPDFTPAHVLLARLYYKLKRSADAERERSIIATLNAEEQKRQPTPDPKTAKASR
jgi:tetratricopeptide (TPR) repeat protein